MLLSQVSHYVGGLTASPLILRYQMGLLDCNETNPLEIYRSIFYFRIMKCRGDMTQCHNSISDSVKIILISTPTVEALNQPLNA